MTWWIFPSPVRWTASILLLAEMIYFEKILVLLLRRYQLFSTHTSSTWFWYTFVSCKSINVCFPWIKLLHHPNIVNWTLIWNLNGILFSSTGTLSFSRRDPKNISTENLPRERFFFLSLFLIWFVHYYFEIPGTNWYLKFTRNSTRALAASVKVILWSTRND